MHTTVRNLFLFGFLLAFQEEANCRTARFWIERLIGNSLKHIAQVLGNYLRF